MIKWSKCQENRTVNVYTLHNRTLKYIKQKLTELKEETDNVPIRVGDINATLSTIDKGGIKDNFIS